MNSLYVKTLIFVLLIAQSAFSQIINGGFESASSGNSLYPEGWAFSKTNEFKVSLDSVVMFSGKRSLRIENKISNPRDRIRANGFPVNINTQKPIMLLISARIKTQDVKTKASISCTVKDNKNNDVGGLFFPTVGPSGTTDWKKFTKSIILDKDANTIIPSLFLAGDGIAWFDDLTIEEAPVNDALPPSDGVTKFITNFIDTVQYHSVYCDSVDWISLRREIKELSSGMVTIDETYPIIDYILSKLRLAGDNHSQLYSKEKVGSLKENSIPVYPEGKCFKNKIGYVKIPGFNTQNDSAAIDFAESVQNLIRSIDRKNKVKGWIVDLRENTGGSVVPMIAGLDPILGMDTLGYSVSPNYIQPWFSCEKGIGSGDEIYMTLTSRYFINNPKSKIAVLISNRTGSSGEATAISFIGKPNTKLFGQPSAGFTTGNYPFLLSNGWMLILARSYMADRNLRKYPKRIDPDVLTENSGSDDTCLRVAMEWLLKK